jgi:hypothetical protein
MSEERLQIEVAKVLDASGLCWCHVPNGGKRNVIVAAKLKRQGVKRGVPDVLIFDGICSYKPNSKVLQGYSGLAIELKNGKQGRVLPEQKAWHEHLVRNGWRVEVCRSLDEVLRVLRECYPKKIK